MKKPFAENSSCAVCRENFTFLKRRHHCRACGRSLCAAHSSRSTSLPEFGYLSNVRVCDTCYSRSSQSYQQVAPQYNSFQPYVQGINPQPLQPEPFAPNPNQQDFYAAPSAPLLPPATNPQVNTHAPPPVQPTMGVPVGISVGTMQARPLQQAQQAQQAQQTWQAPPRPQEAKSAPAPSDAPPPPYGASEDEPLLQAQQAVDKFTAIAVQRVNALNSRKQADMHAIIQLGAPTFQVVIKGRTYMPSYQDRVNGWMNAWKHGSTIANMVFVERAGVQGAGRISFMYDGVYNGSSFKGYCEMVFKGGMIASEEWFVLSAGTVLPLILPRTMAYYAEPGFSNRVQRNQQVAMKRAALINSRNRAGVSSFVSTHYANPMASGILGVVKYNNHASIVTAFHQLMDRKGKVEDVQWLCAEPERVEYSYVGDWKGQEMACTSVMKFDAAGKVIFTSYCVLDLNSFMKAQKEGRV